jgi:chitin biosynthesis protein CHS5
MASTLKVIRSTSQFLLRYSPRHLIPPVAMRYMAAKYHPIRPKILHMYANRDKSALWWRVSINHLPLKRVVRSWCARRVRRAFREALGERGYDHEGRRIQQDNQESSAEVGLNGTAEIMVHQQSIKQDYSSVREECLILVDTLVQMVRGSQPPVRASHEKGIQHSRSPPSSQ